MNRRNASRIVTKEILATERVFKRWAEASSAVAAVLLLASCAGEPPRESVSKAELAVNQATESKAPQIAPLDLRKARDHLNDAKQAMQDKDYQKARRLAENAEVEAELAQAKTDAQNAEATVADLQQTIKALREETAPQ